MAENKEIAISQDVSITNREKITVTGVLEIISSTDKEINLKLENSYLQIVGEKLTILKLEPEQRFLCVKGFVVGLSYQTKHNKKTFFGKVFKWCFWKIITLYCFASFCGGVWFLDCFMWFADL